MIKTDDIVKGDGTTVLAVFPEGRKDSGKSKLIRFYKTDDELFTVICMIEFKLKVSFFSVMTVRVYPSLMPRLFGPAIGDFRCSPIGVGGLGRLIFMFVNLIQWTI